MKVSEYVDYLVNGDCSKLSFAGVGDMSVGGSPTTTQIANQAKFLKFINLANLEIHKRFQLLRKSFEMDYPVDEEEFTLPANFLTPIHAYYTSDWDPVSIKDDDTNIVNDVDTHVSILFPGQFKAVIKGVDQETPVRTQITLKYAAAPTEATLISTDLKVSKAYTEAILHYASFKAHGTISGDIKDENNTYYLRYEAAAKQIVNSGMWRNNEGTRNTKLVDRGFV